MVKRTEPKTLTPYDLMSSGCRAQTVDGEASPVRGYSEFDNWSNWGNGPTNPVRSSLVLEESLG